MTLTLGRVSFPALGTTATVLVAGGRIAVAAAQEAVMAELGTIDRACSRFRPDSELSRLNAAGGRATAVSPLFLEAVQAALRAARLTGGLVDPTVGRAIRLLGYDRDFSAIKPDGPALTFTAEAVRGWQRVRIDRTGPTPLLSLPPGIELDLGATAKALAADRASARASAAAGTGVAVSLGGDLAIAGAAPAGGWPVRVSDHHAAAADADGQTITLWSGGLATSGTTVRRWRRGHVELHHIVNPVTGQPASAVWRTVSVVAATCLDANVASTAAIVQGDGAPAWLENVGLPARLVSQSGSACLVAGWPEP